MNKSRIGVLALQGDFAAHCQALDSIGVANVEVRNAQSLAEVDGLIIPGGESTTLLKLITAFDLQDPIVRFHKEGKAIFGTCAGCILLAGSVAGRDQFSFDFIDITVSRNTYGRQIDSFETEIDFMNGAQNLTIPAVFIRAPIIESAGPEVETLARLDGKTVIARQGKVLVATFHPELTDSSVLHEYFVDSVL